MSASRTSTTRLRVGDVKVPTAAVNFVGEVKKSVWNDECPMASLYAWIMAVVTFRYMFVVPDLTLEVSEDGQTIIGTRIDKNLRGALFLLSLIFAVVGYMAIRESCKRVGSMWSTVTFIGVFLLFRVVVHFALATADKELIPCPLTTTKKIK